ncbi:16601_t:CDS:1 [Cetraspora pellucida]|uniref:16601_t:CDS:1 n=1 Tax=Cetraspora pellucida TaxID=1433469 RepID=A0A9N9A2Z8_9GLOM|nr:16601_t:CDS:1 [Cetraspora pellucida]
MDTIYTLVFSIFLETYSKIYSLAEDFNQLKTFYQTNHDYELKETFETKESSFENVKISNLQDDKEIQQEMQQFDNQILMPLQIEQFRKIFAQHTIKESNEEQETNELF